MKVRLLTSISFLTCFAGLTFAQIIDIPGDYATIQAGIDAASEGDTVLVSEDRYFENINFNGKAITVASQFIMDGDTSHISKTIIDGSQAVDPEQASVVTITDVSNSKSQLSGFTITGGAGSTFTYIDSEGIGGGGIVIEGCGATVKDNIVENNIVESSWAAIGGILIRPGETDTVCIEGNVVRNNEVRSEVITAAGGIWVMGAKNSVIHVHDNLISENKVFVEAIYKAIGGGISIETDYSYGADIQVFNNIIDHNELHCQASHGGGIFVNYQKSTSDPITEAQVKIYNNVISNNYSEESGAGIAVWRGGSGIGKERPVDPIIANNTIVGNKAVNGAGLWNYDAASVMFNNILWNDLSSSGSCEIYNSDVNYPDWGWDKDQNDGILYSFSNNIQGGWEGARNIDADPMFEADSFGLADGSPCIGGGADSILIDGKWYCTPVSDFSGNPRPNLSADKLVDIGAMESPYAYTPEYIGPGIINVPGEAATIQAGIDSASENDTVLVAPGIYYENINFKGKPITVASQFIMDGNSSYISNTIIDGSQPSNPDSASVVTMCSGEDINSVITGFTLTGGTGTRFDIGTHQGNAGGGVYITNGGGTVEHNIIEEIRLIRENWENNLYMAGAGVAVHFATGLIRNNIIRNNEIISGSGAGGCGINIAGEDVLIENNQITGNSSTSMWGIGSGISFYSPLGTTGTVRNNWISNNSLYSSDTVSYRVTGGGVFVQNLSSMEFYNNIINNNHSDGNGGGIGFIECPGGAWLYNNTVRNNSAGVDAKSVFVELGSVVVLFNNIIWSETSSMNDILVLDNSQITTRHNSIAGGWNPTWDIDADPQFKEGTFELSENSLCIGRGADSVEVSGMWYLAPDTDLLGNPRKEVERIDLGAIESVNAQVDFFDFKKIIQEAGDESCPGTFTVLIEGGTPPFSFLIDGSVNDNGDNVIACLEPGSYELSVVDGDGATISASVTVAVVGTDSSITEDNNLRIYPNPAMDYITVQTTITGHFSIEISSANGHVMYYSDFFGNSQQVDLTPYKEGIYFIRVRSDAYIWTEKVVKL